MGGSDKRICPKSIYLLTLETLTGFRKGKETGGDDAVAVDECLTAFRAPR